jgi:hypothetical protein
VVVREQSRVNFNVCGCEQFCKLDRAFPIHVSVPFIKFFVRFT